MKNWLMTILSMSLLLTGGVKFHEPVPCVVVTEVSILYRNENEADARIYTNQDKMNKVLNYLRHVDPLDPTDLDVDSLEGTEYEISLKLSDGNTRTYAQKESLYLRTGDGLWQEIAPEQGIRLPLLLAAIPSDETTT